LRVLVTGGAGYIGSVAVEELLQTGRDVIILDNLSKGHRGAVSPGAELVVGDVGDRKALDGMFQSHTIDAVMHFAADSLVGESMNAPGKYFRSNLCYGIELLDSMVAHGVSNMVFSSTAAVYGEPKSVPILEEDPTVPTNPYGASKMAFEAALLWYGRSHGVRSISLRYFNAAGASERLGEDHDPETHLIPLILEVAQGKRDVVEVFGTNYETPDGTCVRDYVHVADLAQAHILALDALGKGQEGTFNLGNGEGYSVLEVLEAARKVTGKEIPSRDAPVRAGDPAVLVASSARAIECLGWRPETTRIDDIVESAWKWHVAHPDGYTE
jgi:UDP-glucose 4-epimerase